MLQMKRKTYTDLSTVKYQPMKYRCNNNHSQSNKVFTSGQKANNIQATKIKMKRKKLQI